MKGTSSLYAATALALLLLPVGVAAQELEPGAYWPIPKGLNIVTVVNSFNWGDLAFDPSAPIDEANARINTDGVRVYAGVQPGWTIRERGRGVAGDRRSHRRPVSG